MNEHKEIEIIPPNDLQAEKPQSVDHETLTFMAKSEAGKYLISILSILAVIVYRINNIQIQWTEVVLLTIGALPWLSSFIQTVKVGTTGIEATFKAELDKAKQEIKADVKTEADKTEAKINEVRKTSEINQSINAFGTGGKSQNELTDITAYKENVLAEANDPADPQKGKWGGNPVNETTHRRLSARVEEIPNNSYLRRVILRVESTDPTNFRLTAPVTFHLHPTFDKPVIEVLPKDNIAEISLIAYGAFTIGAETDQRQTRLELDLAELKSAGNDPFYTR